MSREETEIKIAVTYENGTVFQHFGHTEEFKFYEVNGTEIVKEEVVGTNGNGHGALIEALENRKHSFEAFIGDRLADKVLGIP